MYANKFLNIIFSLYILVCISKIHAEMCDHGQFRINDMATCVPWIGCDEISKLEVDFLIGYGAVKKIYASKFMNHTVAIVLVNNENFVEDFIYGLENLITLSYSKLIVQLIGYCKSSNVYVTEYHKLGDARTFRKFENSLDILQKFKFCIDYVSILDFLHSKTNGIRVMCDSSSLDKTLEQYLISDNLSLILNDVDALPEVSEDEKIICGHKQLFGNFIAPEQSWPFESRDYNQILMPPYDEKTDVWKIPDVCHYFLGSHYSSQKLRSRLDDIHKQCKVIKPTKRITAREVLKFYRKIFTTFENNSNKIEL